MLKFVQGQDINVMKRILLIPLAVAGLLGVLSMSSFKNGIKTGEGESVKWMTFEQAVEQSKIEKRKIFIDVYTDWCGWCKVMDKSTFSDPAVAKLLNEKFYAVKLNAEQREDIKYNGTTFKFVENGRSGYHQLAAALLNNQLSFPTVVFLDEEFSIIQPLPGYRKAPEFHQIAQYYGEGHYKTEKWEDFQKNSYKSPY
jgi:thioredoxin-related protein